MCSRKITTGTINKKINKFDLWFIADFYRRFSLHMHVSMQTQNKNNFISIFFAVSAIHWFHIRWSKKHLTVFHLYSSLFSFTILLFIVSLMWQSKQIKYGTLFFDYDVIADLAINHRIFLIFLLVRGNSNEGVIVIYVLQI